MRLIGALLIFSLVLSLALGGSGRQSIRDQIVCGERDADSGTTGDSGDLSEIISEAMFEDLFEHRNDAACPAGHLYTYYEFIEAAKAFPEFGNTGNETMRKREVAAFLAQTGHATSGGPDGDYTWGYCYNNATNGTADNCDDHFPCPSPGQYYGRGPIQLTWNYNYINFGNFIDEGLLNNPNFLLTDPLASFKSAIWYWMTPQPPKPSCHQVILGEWTPSYNDVNAGRLPGYGLTTNIINGDNECGSGCNKFVTNRVGFFINFCAKFGIHPGDNLDCYRQQPFGLTLMAQSM